MSKLRRVMMHYLLVAMGSALGGMLRFWTANALERRLGPAFPWGTFMVNIFGSFLIGVMAALAARDTSAFHPMTVRNFLMVGVLGGFTTFSAFSLQSLQLIQSGKTVLAILNIAGSTVLCLLGVWLGHSLGQSLHR